MLVRQARQILCTTNNPVVRGLLGNGLRSIPRRVEQDRVAEHAALADVLGESRPQPFGNRDDPRDPLLVVLRRPPDRRWPVLHEVLVHSGVGERALHLIGDEEEVGRAGPR